MSKEEQMSVVDLPKAAGFKLTAFRWVAKAMAKESTRYALNHLYLTETHIVATDGRRLHFAEGDFSAYKPGFYEMLINRASRVVLIYTDCGGSFPKWQDIVPKHKKFFQASVIETASCESASTLFMLAKVGVFVRPSYLAEAYIEDMACYYDAPDRPVYLTCGFGDKFKLGAVIMPITPPNAKLQTVTEEEAA